MSIDITAIDYQFREFVRNCAYKEMSDWLTSMAHALWANSLLLEEAAEVHRVTIDMLPKTAGFETPVYVVFDHPQDVVFDHPHEMTVVGLARHLSPKRRYSLAKIRDRSLVDPDCEFPLSMAGQLLDDHYRVCIEPLVKELAHWGDDPRYMIIELERPTFFVQQVGDSNLEAFCYIECGLYVAPGTVVDIT